MFLVSKSVIILSALAVVLLVYYIKRDDGEAALALYVPTLALPLTGVITNVIKVAVGMYQPAFLFPDFLRKVQIF